MKNFLIIYFNWRLVTLQYYSHFCHTVTWISHGCTCVLHPESRSHNPPFLSHPSGLSQCTSFECPASCIELMIYFTYGRRLLLGRKVMTNLECILKSRDITLPTMVHLVKAMVFPLVMYGYESWTVKRAECWRIDAFELWCWRRLLRVPWTAWRSN